MAWNLHWEKELHSLFSFHNDLVHLYRVHDLHRNLESGIPVESRQGKRIISGYPIKLLGDVLGKRPDLSADPLRLHLLDYDRGSLWGSYSVYVYIQEEYE